MAEGDEEKRSQDGLDSNIGSQDEGSGVDEKLLLLAELDNVDEEGIGELRQ